VQRETAAPGAQTTTRMVLRPTPTSSPYLFQRVACRELGGEGDAGFRRLRFGGKINLGGHPGGGGASAEGREETETLLTLGEGYPSSVSLGVFFPPLLIYLVVSRGRGEGWVLGRELSEVLI